VHGLILPNGSEPSDTRGGIWQYTGYSDRDANEMCEHKPRRH